MLELGKSLALECTVTGFPIHQVVFRHNQNIIKSISGSIGSIGPQVDDLAAHLGADGRRAAQYQVQGRSVAAAAAAATASGYFVVDSLGEQQHQEGVAAGAPTAPGEPGAVDPDGQPKSASDNELLDQLDQLAREPDQQQNEISSAVKLSHVIVIVLEPQHAGAYQCFAHNQFESVQSSAYIRVLDDPPKFKETFKSEVFEQRQDISLLCAAKANPLPEITWSVDDQPIPESSRTRFGDFVTKDNLVISYVNISSIQVIDAGLYRCTADNGLAHVSHEAQISVYGPPLVKPMANVTVLASTTFRQRCPVAGFPIGDIQWHHQGHRLPTNHRQHVYENGTLEVEHMERSAGDEGEYVCVASQTGAPKGQGAGPAGQPGAQAQDKTAYGSVQVSIRVRPTIEPFAISRNLREGQRASIMCTISSGDLPISISWFRNDQLLVPIPSDGQTGAGNNFIGQTGAPQVAAGVLVSSPAAGDLLPPQDPAGRHHHSNGSAALLPGVTISRVSDYSSTLLFESLLAQHSGNYTCLARNDAGSVSHQAPMIVQGE